MKNLLGMLLLLGARGCGPGKDLGGETDKDPGTGSKAENAKVREAPAVATLEEWGAMFTRNGQGRVFSVTVSNRKQLADPDLAILGQLTALQELDLRGTQITDSGLVHLKGLTGLRRLVLGGTKVTDSGLEYLRGMTVLKTLGLSGTQVSDAGLQHLAAFTNLESLYLGDTQVSDAGLAHLKGLKNLKMLIVSGTRITDAGKTEFSKSVPACKVIGK